MRLSGAGSSFTTASNIRLLEEADAGIVHLDLREGRPGSKPPLFTARVKARRRSESSYFTVVGAASFRRSVAYASKARAVMALAFQPSKWP
jgi:hypothetical protein